MKKGLSIITAFIMMLLSMLPAFQCVNAETVFDVDKIGEEQKKVINIVYDDSGSMINGNETDVSNASAYVATWAQAKYSLEVFTAMMNDDDIINIYCMSGAGAISKTIKGSDKDGGVEDIHSNMKTGDYSVLTPIQTLNSAYEGLSDSEYDDYEKWLVVLTDGAFTVSNSSGDKVNDSEVEGLLNSYGSSLNGKMIYIPIGSSANEYHGSYETRAASNGEEILNQIQDATELIYSGRNGKDYESASINLGVSMKKLIIFAQGSGVEIEGVSKGKITDNISVKYTDAENAVAYNSSKTTFQGNEDKIQTDTSLQGVVATIEPNGECIEPGELDIVFGDKVPSSYTIYCEPAVKAYYSLEKDGIEYLSSEYETEGGSLNPGTYKLTAYIADAYVKDGEIPRNVSETEEIKETAFDITVSGTGVEGGQQSFSKEQLKNGADVHLQRGDVACDGIATIIGGKYRVNTDGLNKAFSGIKVKDTYRLEVKYELPTAPLLSYRFKKTNFTLHSLKKIKNEEDMIKAVVTCYDNDGNKVAITEEQWAAAAQTIKIYKDDTKIMYDESCYNYHIEDGSGVFYLCPRYYEENDKPSKKKTTHTNYIHNKRLCTIRHEVYIDVSDSLAYSTLGSSPEAKSTTYEISLCMWHTIITLIIFFYVFFCFCKPRLPKFGQTNFRQYRKYIRKRENGEIKYHPITLSPMEKKSKGATVNKKMLTYLVPVYPQEAEISLNIPGIPKIKVQGVEWTPKRKKMKLNNSVSDFKHLNGKKNATDENKYIIINGENITEDTLTKRKNKFIFNSSHEIEYGSRQGSYFKKYKLSFKKDGNKKKGKKK